MTGRRLDAISPERLATMSAGGEQSPRIGVVDYGMGNRRSAEKALEHVGARVEVSGDPERLREMDGLVLPGVEGKASGVGDVTLLFLTAAGQLGKLKALRERMPQDGCV